jgi:hypothetical protein
MHAPTPPLWLPHTPPHPAPPQPNVLQAVIVYLKSWKDMGESDIRYITLKHIEAVLNLNS